MNKVPEQTKSTPSPSIKSFSTFDEKKSSLYSGKSRNAIDCETKKSTLQGHRQCIIQITTVLQGSNLGRIYYLKPNMDTPDDSRLIVTYLSDARIRAMGRAERRTRFEKSQDAMRKLHESLTFQIIVAAFILLVCFGFDSYCPANGWTDIMRFSRTFWPTQRRPSS
jgi:hypothetical protein